MKRTLAKKLVSPGLLVLIVILLARCTSAPEWQKKNNNLIKQYSLTERQLAGLPKTNVVSNLQAGKVTTLDSIANTVLYPGVNAKIYWGTGTMAGILQLEPNAKIPEEVLPSEQFLFVLEGSVDQVINGSSITMISRKREEPDGTHSATPRIDFVYLEKGSKSAIKAGPSGAKLLAVYSPVRLDYLQKAGVKNVPAQSVDLPTTQVPNVKPNLVYDLYEFQLTALTAGANSRLVTGKNTQVSFISMDPGTLFDRHIHPEEQMMLVLRGGCNEILLDGEQSMAKNNVVLIPGNMVHGAKVGDLGCDAIDIFWPARADYAEKEKARLDAYHVIIPEDAKLDLFIDGTKTKPGLTFSEGPKWMNGKVYFSNMYFDQKWTGSPKKAQQLSWIQMELTSILLKVKCRQTDSIHIKMATFLFVICWVTGLLR